MSGPTIGLMLPAIANTDTNLVDPPRVLAAARLAEQAGFDGVYVGDHLLHPRGLLEAVVTLSAVAASVPSCLASHKGSRSATSITQVPILILLVVAATADSVTTASSKPRG